jgi:hypothetical protein
MTDWSMTTLLTNETNDEMMKMTCLVWILLIRGEAKIRKHTKTFFDHSSHCRVRNSTKKLELTFRQCKVSLTSPYVFEWKIEKRSFISITTKRWFHTHKSYLQFYIGTKKNIFSNKIKCNKEKTNLEIFVNKLANATWVQKESSLSLTSFVFMF